jgi:hypothetical protein
MKTPIFQKELAMESIDGFLKECVKVVLKTAENNSDESNHDKIKN